MNGSFGDSGNEKTYIVRLRGLPWNTSPSEVQSFLQGSLVDRESLKSCSFSIRL